MVNSHIFFQKTALINTVYDKFILKFTANIYKMALFHLVTLLILFFKNNKYNEQKSERYVYGIYSPQMLNINWKTYSV